MTKYVFCSEIELQELISTSIKDAIQKAQSIWQTNQEEQEEILNADQAAKLLKIAKQTLYSKTSRQEIPFMKRGKKLIFKKSDLLEYLEKGRYLTNAQIEAKANDYINNK